MAVAAMAQDNDDPDLETTLLRALRLRSSYLKGQADLLTLPAVRRLLEKDLGLKASHLDAHKALIKGLVDKVLNGADNDAKADTVVTEKPTKRRKKRSRVVEDLQDGDGETHRNRDESSDVNMQLVQNVDTDQEEPTMIDEENSEDEGTWPENAGERDAERPEGHGNAVEEPSKEDQELSEKQEDVQQGSANADDEAILDTDVSTQGNLVKRNEELEGDTEETLASRNEESLLEDNPVPEDLEDRIEEGHVIQEYKGNIDENAIKDALMSRADELKAQAESLTVTTVRHLLAKDLGLEPAGLDVHKQFIRRLVDELLGDANEEPIVNPSKVGKAKREEAAVRGERRLKKKGNIKSPLGKRSTHREETEDSEEKLQGDGELSESASEERRPGKVRIQKKKNTAVKTKAMVIQKSADLKRPFSANVERLREILKAVGIGVSPIVYKKAKQAPEDEREEVLVKELENRLSQEGLSPNPTEKEIRKVKTRLEKKKDLDGIDNSNIVAEPRRSRAAANSWFTPRQNKYSQVEIGDKSSDEDSGDDAKPIVTGAMDD